MDEILINEKKYISSKQAAKMTGYAKDYIGQLCREGRVPARLVGRSWYVLESAIQDHRFGSPEPQESQRIQSKTPRTGLAWAKEAPRYESAPIELLPTINRPISPEVPVVEENQDLRTPENLQNSWKAWFDRVGEAAPADAPEYEPEAEKIESEELPRDISQDSDEINIPIHTLYKAPPRELLPNYMPEQAIEMINEPQEPVIRVAKGKNRGMGRAIQALLVIVGMITVSLAAFGSGYLDSFLVTNNNQVSAISGIKVYNR